jgi:hypothetical protein
MIEYPSNQTEARSGMGARLRTLARASWALPAGIWALLYAWRPLLFGFYHDDWSLLLGCNGSILQEIYCVDASRPGAPLIRWIIHEFIGASPAAWQFVTTISMLGAALTLMALLRRMARAGGVADVPGAWAAAIAAAFYLAFPWMLGLAWVTAISPNVATICFTFAMYVWLTRWPLVTRCLTSAAFFCLSSLIYEAYWFAFLPFAALLWLRALLPRRDLMVLTLSLAGAQLALIGFNRTIAALAIGANKSFDPGWLHTLTGAWPALIGGLRDIYGISGRYVFGALLLSVLVCLGTRLDVRRALATLGPILAGIAISFALFALAGYVVVLTGLFARTMIVVSWWLALATAFGAAHAASLPRRPRLFAGAASLALLLMLAGGTLTQSRYWTNSWAEQQDILAKLPRDELLAASGPSFLVIDAPRPFDKVGAFNAWYDISAAIWTLEPKLARHLAGTAMISSPIAVVSSGFTYFRITPNRVTVNSCFTHDLLTDNKSEHVLLWKYPERSVETISSNAEIHCPDRFQSP